MSGFTIRPWRSVRVPQFVTVVALAIGLPIYRAPLWCDLTLYDIAARNLLWGGTLYRDVFDTNLPGFVWILSGIRWAFGFSTIALRCVDLAVVAGIVLVIDRIARRGGATPATRWWAVAAVAVLYPSAVEMAHAQRDTWMALPVVAAVLVRLRRSALLDVPWKRAFPLAFLEGALWGIAVWIKPHCVLMAAGVWLATAWRVGGASANLRSGFAADLLGNLAGGLAIGLSGIAVVLGTGAWPGLWEVLTVWAPDYMDLAKRERFMRYDQELHWFPPWSLWLVPTVPLAVLSLLDMISWPGDRPDWSVAFCRDGCGIAMRDRTARFARGAGGALPRLGGASLLRPARLYVRPHGRTVPHVRALGGASVGHAGNRDPLARADELGLARRRRLSDRSRLHVSDRAAR